MTLLPYSSLKRSTKPIPKKRKHPRTRKTVIRLTGDDMTRLRFAVWIRYGGRCVDCHQLVGINGNGSLPKMDLCHIKSRGANGDDTVDNCLCKCHECHMREHNGKKPVPPK